MSTNLETFRTDLKKLISQGMLLLSAMRHEHQNEEFIDEVFEEIDDQAQEYIANLPDFYHTYQSWYSESIVLLKQLLPDRVADFRRYYEKPRTRKNIIPSNYVIEDYLQKIRQVVPLDTGPEDAIPQFEQQLAILRSAQRRFTSSLFEIKQLLQADLFDSELGAAKELGSKGFVRGAGAIAGVVLEGHLKQVCENHDITIDKKNATLSDYYNALRSNNVIDLATMRLIQLLGDIRNKCDHKKDSEPTKEEVSDLIEGVEKIIKTVF